LPTELNWRFSPRGETRGRNSTEYRQPRTPRHAELLLQPAHRDRSAECRLPKKKNATSFSSASGVKIAVGARVADLDLPSQAASPKPMAVVLRSRMLTRSNLLRRRRRSPHSYPPCALGLGLYRCISRVVVFFGSSRHNGRQGWWCCNHTPNYTRLFWGALAMALIAGIGALVGRKV
jgi:hypothetical protein